MGPPGDILMVDRYNLPPMHRLLLIALLLPIGLSAQVDIVPNNIKIIRDTWGVPHIYAPTDAEAAYGIAWAQAEDNFHNMQETLLAAKGLLAAVEGPDGALLDAIMYFVNADAIVERSYATDVSDHFKGVLEGYCAGLNRYAETYEFEVRHHDLFPIGPKDILKTYVASMSFMANIHYDVIRVFENLIHKQEVPDFSRGSNAWAYNENITETGETVLVCNSHQPLEGPMAWYELHVSSEEGWNFYGATLGGGVTPFIGTNEHLGWTHTVNYDDFNDVYKLEMHPEDDMMYRVDDDWLELEERVLKLKVKIGPIRLPVKRTFYQSIYGPTLKNDSGYYAFRFPANMTIQSAEQWFRMNKATDFDEFVEALEMQGLPNFNIIYGDKEGNILKVGNGLFPYRDPDYNWLGVVPGNTRETLWDTAFLPLDSLVFVKNPSCGYVFNMNHTSMNCTCPEENPDRSRFSPTIGYQQKETARSIRFMDLMEGRDRLSYQDIKDIKYDGHYSFPLYTRTIENLDLIRNLDPAKYPDLADVITLIDQWHGSTDRDDVHTAILAVSFIEMKAYIKDEGIYEYNNTLPEEVFVRALRAGKEHMLEHFGRIDVPLGEVQFIVRGDTAAGIWGMPEVLTAMNTDHWTDGRLKDDHGDCFILFATYDSTGVNRLEAVQPFGVSQNPGERHYKDQMELFVNKQLREAWFDYDDVVRNAETAYCPL